MKINLPFNIKKWFYFEFWPFWIFYFPMYGYGLYLAIKARSFSYFTAANPGMKFGGAFGMDKMEILNSLDKEYIPKGFLVCQGAVSQYIIKQMHTLEISFPIICKPNVGERGIGVEKIDSKENLVSFLKVYKQDIIVQEYIDFPIELGIFYHQYPLSLKDGITSVVIKEFLSITGDGKSKFGDLVKDNNRAKSRISYLEKKYKSIWEQVIPDGSRYKLEPIGNHNRGTKFINGNHLINDQLISVFRKISKPLRGYYYGRFDLKAKSLVDLQMGKNIKIIELNGVNSEPAHIYDPNYSLLKAYIEIINHMKLIYEISKETRKQGSKPDPFNEVLKGLFQHLFLKK